MHERTRDELRPVLQVQPGRSGPPWLCRDRATEATWTFKVSWSSTLIPRFLVEAIGTSVVEWSYTLICGDDEGLAGQ